MGVREVYVTRHGERIDNVERRWMSGVSHARRDDPHLSPRGRVQAQELADELLRRRKICIHKHPQRRPVDHIVSSPFYRCVETASIVGYALDLPVCIEPGICEVLFDYPPGLLPVEDLQQEFPNVDLGYKPTTALPRSGESGDDACIRRSAVAAGQIAQALGGSLLFVGHGASCVGILKAFTGTTQYQGFCTLSRLVEADAGSNEWMAEAIGSADHLSDKTNLRAY